MAAPAQIPKSDLPAPAGAGGGLGSLIENVIQRGFGLVFDAIKGSLAHVIRLGVELIMESFEQIASRQLAPAIDQVLASPDLPEWFRSYLKELKNPTSQISAAGLASFQSGMASGAAGSALAPVFRVLNYTMDRQLHTMRPDLSLLYAMYWRVPESREWMAKSYLDTGWAPAWEPWIQETVRPRLGPADLITIARRAGQDPTAMHDEIARFGYSDTEITRMIELSKIIPGPGELISMAVREAWDEEFAALGKTDEGLPGEFVAWSGKQGLSPDWCKRYWRAHWQLPSPQMGMEMLHRGVITDAEFEKLLKALDISPGWRDKLKSISYAVPTRVDIRRAFRDGVIGEQQVKRAYLDFGYDEKWADILTKWTVIAYAPEEKEVTVSDIRSALERGTLTESEATEMWQSLDVGDEAIGFYIAQVRFKKAEALKQKRLDAVETKFVSGRIDRAAAATQLSALGLPGSEIEVLLETWTVAREAKVRQPSESQWRGFYLDDLIPVDVFRRELGELGYDDETIALYIRAADAEKTRQAALEAERAQNEQERIATAERASAYQKNVASTDVQIAQQKMSISNAQAALNAGLSDQEILDANLRLDQLDEQIAAEQKQIAVFREQIAIARNTLDARISAVLRHDLDERIGTAQTAIAEFDRSVAALNVEIAQAKVELLTVETDTEKQILKQSIAAWQLQQATLRENVEAQQLDITIARNELRLYITDDERQALERTIRDSDEGIRRRDVVIAEYRAEQVSIRAGIAAALNSDQRVTLSQSVNAARKRIAELQVERAEARVEV